MPGDVRCQVRGCGNAVVGTVLQRYRVCDQHLREPTVEVDGQPQRFCRQCRKFHPLIRFDGRNMNCAEKLRKHNQRRRAKRQQHKIEEDEAPQPRFAPAEPLDADEGESGSDEDKSFSASLKVEFKRLRKLQRSYYPISSGSLDNAVNTAFDIDSMDVENSTHNWERAMDGQSETNSHGSEHPRKAHAGERSPANNWNSSTASTSFEASAEAPVPNEEGEELSGQDLLAQGPRGWNSTLTFHESFHVCAGMGCYVCASMQSHRPQAAPAHQGQWAAAGMPQSDYWQR